MWWRRGVVIPISFNFLLFPSPSFNKIDLPSLGGDEGCNNKIDISEYKKTSRCSFISLVALSFFIITFLPSISVILISLCQFTEYKIY